MNNKESSANVSRTVSSQFYRVVQKCIARECPPKNKRDADESNKTKRHINIANAITVQLIV